MNKRKIRNSLRFFSAALFSWLYVPALLCGLKPNVRADIRADVERMMTRIDLSLPPLWALVYLLHTNRYFRKLYYHRIGPVRSLLVSWIRPGDRYFIISNDTAIGPGVLLAHPYSTILNARKIGKNFSFIHATTLGDAKGETPTIGDDVTLGAGVTIVGGVTIGKNVTIGAGSVVVKDIPSDSIAVGNPARVVRKKERNLT